MQNHIFSKNIHIKKKKEILRLTMDTFLILLIQYKTESCKIVISEDII